MSESSQSLPLRKLGNTDIMISPLGLGAWQFSGGKGIFGSYWKALPADVTADIVEAAVKGGINWFDTAEAYGWGESEHNLSNALKTKNIDAADIRIATKWWPVLRPASSIANTIEERLGHLQGYPIDHYIVHNPFSRARVESEMHAMADLMDAGKIRSVGVSNFTANMMRRAHKVLEGRGYSLAANQCHYNLMGRGIERNGILDAAKELGITIIAWSPLEQGMLTGRMHDNQEDLASMSWMRRQVTRLLKQRVEKSRPLIETMKAIGKEHEATVAQVALNWLITAHGDTVVAIPGASKISQLEQNLGAMTFRLTEAEIDALSKAASGF